VTKHFKHYTRLGQYNIEEVLPFIGQRKQYGKTTVFVREGPRMRLFERTQICACCHLKGLYFWLEKSGSFPFHFNLYGLEDGREVMMTLDHILARSQGGTKKDDNVQLLCEYCNRAKKDKNMTLDELRKKRGIHEPRIEVAKLERDGGADVGEKPASHDPPSSNAET
jgi:5-methylcytosine-specific restriction endonuclease McrA